ncbi:hypothetical protein [Rhodovulum steppense]|uniref:Uncharacterized protein n=1 Tax=Rhodovulum steppense TaxID=540251 RepID=A0A4R1YW27_9RHOB|nr:hypothetical protein [Rhodovulum steppense]TCM85176.1 hypothetical protein EV216_10827 [Rhodovulum steppense]
MFAPIISIPINEIEPESVVWRGPWFGDALEASAGQAAVLQGDAGMMPGYFAGNGFISRADLACASLSEASVRAKELAQAMCCSKKAS